jgi:hypothetical protein
MPDFALRRLRPVLDLGEQFRFDPDALVRDPLRVRLRLVDQGPQALLQVGRGCLVEAIVDLAGIDEILALAPAEIDAVPLAFVEREPGDGQRLTLRAGFLDPFVAAPGRIYVSRTFDMTPSRPSLHA